MGGNAGTIDGAVTVRGIVALTAHWPALGIKV
jgi:hypothetical protein